MAANHSPQSDFFEIPPELINSHNNNHNDNNSIPIIDLVDLTKSEHREIVDLTIKKPKRKRNTSKSFKKRRKIYNNNKSNQKISLPDHNNQPQIMKKTLSLNEKENYRFQIEETFCVYGLSHLHGINKNARYRFIRRNYLRSSASCISSLRF